MKSSLRYITTLGFFPFCCSVLGGSTLDSYWPIHEGDHKTFVYGNKQLTMDVSRSWSSSSEFLISFDSPDGSGSETHRVDQNGDFLVRVKAGWTSVSFDPDVLILEDGILQNGGSKATSTTVSQPGATYPATFTVKVSKAGTVTVPAGKFLDCRNITVSEKATVPGQGTVTAQALTAVLAPGVGIIKKLVEPGVWCELASGTVAGVDVRDLAGKITPDPFAAVKGTYSGLISDVGGVSHSSSGCFTLTATDKGVYSAKLQIGGNPVAASGQLDSLRKAVKTIARPNQSSLTLELALDGADGITGTVSDGTWTAQLRGDRSVFDGRNTVAPQAGRYTVVFPYDSHSTTQPGGHSYGTIAIDQAGKIKFAGSLADGTKISQSAQISKDGQWPLYIPLYNRQGSLLSWMTFASTATDDLRGNVVWIKPGASTGNYYRNGFTLQSAATGCRYMPPANGAKVLNLTEADVVLTGGNLPQGITSHIVIGANSKVTNPSGNKLTLTFTAATGTFSGSVVNPATQKTVAFSGATLQKRNIGRGFFLGTDQSGEVLIFAD